jgi:soluble lytic murein transglycosylase
MRLLSESMLRLLLSLALCLPTLAAADAVSSATVRRQFEAAHHVAQHDPAGRWVVLARGLEDYPLYPYLEYAALTRDLGAARPAAVTEFLTRQDGTPLADQLRTRWLRLLASRRRHAELLAAWRERDDPELRCAHAAALLATGATRELTAAADALWTTGRSLPTACDPVIAWLAAQRRLTPERVWQRIRLAAEARQHRLVGVLARRLPPAERAEAERWATTLANPAVELGKATGWTDTPRTRELVVIGLVQLARRDAARAATVWTGLAKRLAFGDAERGRVLAAIALWKAAAFEADAGRWLAQVPDAAFDDALREWRVREALARADYPAVVAASNALAPAQQADPRWRWVRARALELSGQPGAAQSALATLAGEPSFHGFLAADRLDRPYSLCPLEASVDAAVSARIAALPGLQRAFELRALDWQPEARREWDYALRPLAVEDRAVAVALAHARGWIERGPLTLLGAGETRYYALRFPLAFEREIDTHARRTGLDAAWVLGVIRAESAWMPDARSPANAHGLMQLLPSTARAVARREKLPYRAPSDLHRPPLNIALGTQHLADVLDDFDGRVWLATAAYNAGPAPVRRWLAARPALPTDLWIETIPYKETREYVARVLAFALIYDWRRSGRAQALAPRLALSGATGTRRDVVCAAPGSLQTASAKP